MSELDTTTGELAPRLGAELVGPADIRVRGLEALAHAGPEHLTFIRDARHAGAWSSSRAGAAVVTRGVEVPARDGSAILYVDDADRAMIVLLEQITPEHSAPPAGAHPSATVDPTATIGEGVRLGPGVWVGAGARVDEGAVLHANAWVGKDAKIGSGSDLRAGVVVEDRCVVGRGVLIHPNAVIGADGFGYRPSDDGASIVKIPHAGWVEIGDGVEIGASTTVDRGKFGSTVIGAGTKIDNQVQIGHNCRIGRCCIICGAVGIAGSVEVGDGVTIGGGVRIRDNVKIGPGATLGGNSAVAGDVPAGATWFGAPAREASAAQRDMLAASKLAETLRDIRRRLKQLERETT